MVVSSGLLGVLLEGGGLGCDEGGSGLKSWLGVSGGFGSPCLAFPSLPSLVWPGLCSVCGGWM